MDDGLKVFEKVLVRDSIADKWQADIFSSYKEGDYCYRCIGGAWRYCVPYADHEDWLDTKQSLAPNNYEPTFQFGDIVHVRSISSLSTWQRAVIIQVPEDSGEPYRLIAELFPNVIISRAAKDIMPIPKQENENASNS